MPVYLDVVSRLDERALVAASRRLVDEFARTGNTISHGLGSSLARAFDSLDGSAARRELLALQQEFRRTADVEADAAARMIRDQRRLAEATAKYGEDSSKAAAANAVLARSQRDHVDAMVAAEAAHRGLAKAGGDTADSVSRLQKLGSNPIFNAVGIGSVGAAGVALVDFGHKAGDFQQQMIRLQASAGELPQNLKTVSDGILQMAGQVGYSAGQLADGMYTVEKAGYRGADGLKVLQSAAQLAKAENADLGEVLNGLTTSMNDYNIPVSQAADVASKLNVAVGLAKTNLQEFSGALHSVEPVAMTAHVGIDQVYGDLARLTQSGMSPDQGSQNLAQTMRNFMGPNAQMRDALGKLGLSAHQLQTELGDPSVGLNGVLQQVADRIRQLGGPNGQVAIDAFYKSADASKALQEAYDALSPSAKQLADQLKSGTLTNFKGLRLAEKNDPALKQWDAMRNKVDGLSSNLRKLQPDLETVQQLFRETTGGAETLNVLSQLFGTPEDGQKTADAVNQVSGAVAEADGTVKGFDPTMQGVNAKMDQAKAAFGAAATKLGQDFIPVINAAAAGLKDVADELEQHPGLAQAAAGAVGAMGAAWLLIKGYNLVSTVLSPIGTGLGMLKDKLFSVETQATTAGGAMRGMGGAAAEGVAGVEAAASAEVAAEGRVTAAAGEANAAMAGGKAGGAGLAAAAGPLGIAAAGSMAANDVFGSLDRRFHTNMFTKLGEIPGSGAWVAGQLFGHAEGGPLHAPGPKGTDSALFWGADGEHVLTHHEVQKMGGHSGVYQFRSDLMSGRVVLGRAGGGALGYGGMAPDVAVAESMAGTPYSQGARDDCSGMVGRVVLGAMGLPATGLPTTKNMGQWLEALGFQPGIGGPGSISVGWYDHGGGPNSGHAAMTLSNGENAESGGSHGNFIVGSGAAGASSSQFDHHMFLPTLYGEGPGGGMPGFGGMGGGFGGGAFGGGGFGGASGAGAGGYYTANPQKVAAAQERLQHLDQEIQNAEERKSELKSTAKQSERDRLDEEIRHLKAERTQAEGKLQEAQRGTFHRGRGGMGGSPFLPVPLANQFGLSKGLPGLAEWLVGFAEDMVLGPLETAAWAAIGQSPPGAGGLGGLGGGLGPAGLGFANPGLPGAPGADMGGPSRGNEIGPASSGGAGVGSGAPSGSSLDFVGSPSAPGASIPHPAPGSGYVGSPSAPGLPAGVLPPLTPAGSPPLINSLLSGRAQGMSPGFKPGAGMGPDRNNIPGFTPWDLAARGQQAITDWAQGSPFGMSGIGAPRPGFHQMQVPPYTPPPPPPQPGLPPDVANFFTPGAQHHATGGPSGTDTIPAWLSPDEYVEPKSAVDRYGTGFMNDLRQGRIDPSSVRYYAPGGSTNEPSDQQPPQPQNMVKTPGAPSGPSVEKPAGAPKPGQPAGPKPSGGGATSINDKGVAALTTPGADANQPGTGQPAQPGIGFSGGALGALEGAASSGASMGVDMVAPGAGQAAGAAMQIGFQELNRAAAAGAQYVGIGAEGLLEALIPNAGGSSSDWSKTIPGRLLMGVTGVRPAGQQNTAGQTQQPFAPNSSGDQFADAGGNVQPQAPIQILGPVHVQANNANEMHESLNEHTNMAAATVGVQRSASQAYW